MKNKKRRIFIYILVVLFWGAFPPAYEMAMRQRGMFAIGGEWRLIILPFVIAEIVFTLEDMAKSADYRVEDRQ